MTIQRSLKNAEIPSYETMFANNMFVWERAQEDKFNFDLGYFWYDTEHDNCVLAKADLLAKFGLRFSTRQTTDSVAMCSPGRKWNVNIRDASYTMQSWRFDTLEERQANLASFGVVSRRYGWPMFVRIWDYLSGEYTFSFKSAPKTFSFGDVLEYPTSSPYCVIDQHNCHILLGEFLLPQESIGISYAQYQKLLPVMYDSAKHVGLDHRRFQAVLWQWRVANTSKAKEII